MFQYSLETMLTAIVAMDRVLLLLLLLSSLLSLSLLAAAAVFVVFRGIITISPFNPGCHSGSPHAKIHNVYVFHFIKPLSFNAIKLSTKIYDQSFLSES
jgi:hypothetical protein